MLYNETEQVSSTPLEDTDQQIFLRHSVHTVYTRVEADNFWLNFYVQVVGVGLYAGHAIQPESA